MNFTIGKYRSVHTELFAEDTGSFLYMTIYTDKCVHILCLCFLWVAMGARQGCALLWLLGGLLSSHNWF